MHLARLCFHILNDFCSCDTSGSVNLEIVQAFLMWSCIVLVSDKVRRADTLNY
jgi:hypothetical protein